MKTAECQLKLKNNYEAAGSYVEAGNAYKKTNKTGIGMKSGFRINAPQMPVMLSSWLSKFLWISVNSNRLLVCIKMWQFCMKKR